MVRLLPAFSKEPFVTKKPSLADVAAAAGVSVATVSRALNTPGIVKAKLRERVLQASRELGYVPHGAARALASRRNRSIGVVVPTLGLSVFARGVEALQDRLSDDGYRLLVANSQYDPAKELQEIQSLLAHGVDGLVLVGNDRLPETRKLLRQNSCPVVVTFVHEAAEEYPAVGIDNFASACDMTRHLVSAGHTRFSILTSPAGYNDRIRSRRDGIVRSIEDAGASLERLIEIPYTMEAGREGLNRIVNEAPLTTCVICTADLIAVGALAEARRIGLDVPGDLSIAGFDGLDLSDYLTPGLSTVVVPAADIGTLAAERVLEIISGGKPPAETVLDPRLSIRGSTGAPRAGGRLAARRGDAGSGEPALSRDG